jgi:hypothetical protein
MIGLSFLVRRLALVVKKTMDFGCKVVTILKQPYRAILLGTHIPRVVAVSGAP